MLEAGGPSTSPGRAELRAGRGPARGRALGAGASPETGPGTGRRRKRPEGEPRDWAEGRGLRGAGCGRLL